MSECEVDIPIVVWADLETAPLGQAGKLLEDLAGQPVLRRTMARVCRSVKSAQKIVFCRPEQSARITEVLTGLPVQVLPIAFERPGWWPGLQTARKWAADCWRGGLLGACAFDEDFLAHVLGQLGQRLNAPALMTVAAHAAWVDPAILDRQIERYRENWESMSINFTQAPPGLAGLILAREVIEQLPVTMKFPGSILGYHPDRAQIDLLSKVCNLPLEPAVVQTNLRFLCDTRRSLALARRLAARLDPDTADSAAVTSRARAEADDVCGAYPREIELELMTGWPWDKGYRPSPAAPRGPIDPAKLIDRVAELAAECDDLRVHIGGFGEPTRHPQFVELVQGLKQAGVWGLSVQTTGLFEPALRDTLAALPLDLIVFLIDVPHRELYQSVTGRDGYATVLENLEQTGRAVQSRQRAVPLLVPSMIKTHETMEWMDDFFDGWMRKIGWAVIEGFSDYAGQVPDRAVSAMAGPHRKPCRQIRHRLTILADGRAVICNQDFDAQVPVGCIEDRSLQELWRGTTLTRLRACHEAGDFACNALCKACRQWHRP